MSTIGALGKANVDQSVAGVSVAVLEGRFQCRDSLRGIDGLALPLLASEVLNHLNKLLLGSSKVAEEYNLVSRSAGGEQDTVQGQGGLVQSGCREKALAVIGEGDCASLVVKPKEVIAEGPLSGKVSLRRRLRGEVEKYTIRSTCRMQLRSRTSQ